ncbi:endoplasmic reticulum junction formation protein lunapark (LNP) [Vairimorpha necatrix]|uniref:Endoplasmic reticulum junction formation protein lunapark n=1 Tax=Vairimorpha necatrix TaxID=6039 RepID=A0AAX4JAE5_9MICR
MGNVVSKKKSTREIVRNLDKLIIQTEKKKKNLVKSKASENICLFYFFLIFLICSFLFALLNEYNLILFIFLPVVSIFFIKFVSSLVYSWRLESILVLLEDLHQQQKEYIQVLKSEEDYKDTIEILNKYEDSTQRNTSFSKISQKKSNLLENVADIVLGEDPTKMYALICTHCHYHNGMIHPDDELSEYVCYNCGTKNQRKKKTK